MEEEAAQHEEELLLIEDEDQIPLQIAGQLEVEGEEDSGDEFDVRVDAGDDTVHMPATSTPNRPSLAEPVVTPIIIRLPRHSAVRSPSSSPTPGPSSPDTQQRPVTSGARRVSPLRICLPRAVTPLRIRLPQTVQQTLRPSNAWRLEVEEEESEDEVDEESVVNPEDNSVQNPTETIQDASVVRYITYI